MPLMTFMVNSSIVRPYAYVALLCVALLTITQVGSVSLHATQASSWATAGGGRWVVADDIVRQAESSLVDPKKYIVPGLASSGDQTITARVRVDNFPHAESRAGLALRTNSQSGHGFNFVLLANRQVGFLADGLVFGTTCAYTWLPGQWYWMQLSIEGTTLTGRIWTRTQSVSEATVCTQFGWTQFPTGAPGLNGGAFGETVSFDDVTIGAFVDRFDSAAVPAAPTAAPSIMTRRDFLTAVQQEAQAASFDLTGFVNLLHATATQLVCVDNPGACQNYAPGTFAVIPAPFYNGGTWMRDSTWTLGGLRDASRMSALTSLFASAVQPGTGRMPTLLINNTAGTVQPWYGAGGQGNPVPDDDSNLMFVIAARLGGQTVATLPVLQDVSTWIRTHATPDGRYRTTSHGWHDSFYPLGINGDASVTTDSTMQGLYAVALRALQDLGVSVPQTEIDAAAMQYRALTFDGRMVAYEGSDRVRVSSLMGDALSLYLWNQPLLPDVVVQRTIAAFAEVFDGQGRFVGYKIISEANGAFLPAGDFPVENGGAGTGPGDYQNGGSWFLYDAFALYAGIRHDLGGLRAVYVNRLVDRFAAELRAGVGLTPANRSNEFLCTAPGNPGDPCSPTGSAVPERADYGWNAFVLRLLSDEDPPPVLACPGGASTCHLPFGQVDTPTQNATGVVGAIGVTGWVLDDVGVTSVKVYRGCLVASEPQNCQTDVLAGQSLVYIGDAVFVAGARPDVAAAFPGYPAGDRAGWGLSVLTNMLPRSEGNYASTGGQGPVTFYAVATDVEGNRRLLGRAYTDTFPQATTVTLNNDAIDRPFGTLDTPAQGATVSGTIVSFGWALTPDSDTAAGAGDIFVPTDGTTIVVYLDDRPIGTVTYNQCRGSNLNNGGSSFLTPGVYCDDDIASAFGHPTPQPTFTLRTANPTRHRNLDAGRGVIGSFSIDTTTLSNGLHSIAWSVTDSQGRVEGIGSRQFTVLNGGNRATVR